MDEEKLVQLRTLIESIEKMSSVEREALLERVREMRTLSRERRQEFLNNFDNLDRRQRRILIRAHYQSSPDERQKILEELQAIDNEEDRLAYFSELEGRFGVGVDRIPPSPRELKPEMRAPGEVPPAPPAR